MKCEFETQASFLYRLVIFEGAFEGKKNPIRYPTLRDQDSFGMQQITILYFFKGFVIDFYQYITFPLFPFPNMFSYSDTVQLRRVDEYTKLQGRKNSVQCTRCVKA